MVWLDASLSGTIDFVEGSSVNVSQWRDVRETGDGSTAHPYLYTRAVSFTNLAHHATYAPDPNGWFPVYQPSVGGAWADTAVWNGNAGNGSLSDGGNWDGGAAPAAGDTLDFSAVSSATAPPGWKPPKKPNLVFGILSDTHLMVEWDGKSLYRTMSFSYIRNALKLFKGRGIDALVHLGDAAHRGAVRELEFHRVLFEEAFAVARGQEAVLRPVAQAQPLQVQPLAEGLSQRRRLLRPLAPEQRGLEDDLLRQLRRVLPDHPVWRMPL